MVVLWCQQGELSVWLNERISEQKEEDAYPLSSLFYERVQGRVDSSLVLEGVGLADQLDQLYDGD